ncbi:MAG: capsular polysaccharide synthesis protein [Muribaculaceae bacterium]|nr:capsular polysaccharide synthesis protein [Muribaculaceae bacterium]
MTSKLLELGWKIRRIYDFVMMKISFVIKGDLLNPMWYTRDKRRKIRQKARGECVRYNLRAYIPIIRKIKITPQATESPEPERAFTLWLQGEDKAPAIVKACFRNMRRFLRQELVVIDQTNLFNWISLPDYIVEKWQSGKIGHAHFSDICRVELLYRHGGIWLDATDYVTSPVPQDIMNTDFFVFMSGQKLNGWYSYIQNCFIRSRKGNPLLGIWREVIHTYWKREDSVVNYYTHQILFHLTIANNDQAAKLFSKMPHIEQDPTHILWYEHKDDPYDKENYDVLKRNAFFHKTTYKDKSAIDPLSGSIAEHLIKYCD